MKLPIALLALLASTSLSLAQTDTSTEVNDKRCWLGSKTYTEGATMRAAAGVMVCTSGGHWKKSDLAAAGCISGGNLYSVGAINVVGKIKFIQCTQNGTWEEYAMPNN